MSCAPTGEDSENGFESEFILNFDSCCLMCSIHVNTALKSPCFQQLKKEAETEFKQAKAEAILKASKEIEKVKSGLECWVVKERGFSP
jgi:hypothetical protein